MVHHAPNGSRSMGPLKPQTHPAAILHPVALAAHAAVDAGPTFMDEVAQGLGDLVHAEYSA
jgi:hypothetical protein